MHSIVTTSGFVIDSRSYGEADKVYSIFTRDQGLIRAVAQGIRLEKSKLRYHIKENELALFSLVRGRDMWRLTNAQEQITDERLVEEKSRTSASAELLARVSLILRRVLHGEEPNPTLFEHIEMCAGFLRTNPGLTNEQLQTLESLSILRILHALGYVGSDADLQDCLNISSITPEILNNLNAQRAILNKHINRAIKESHL